ncbi:MAG: alpha/beta hydrolase [Rikenellaceae bacterium]
MEAFISAGDSIIRYSRFGKGTKTIVLLHGYGQSMDTFEDLGGQLGKSFDVVLMDLPGSGFSTWGEREVITVKYMAECVSEVLTKLGVERYFLVGHSMGGYVAAELIAADSARIEGVQFLHSLPFGDSEERRALRRREIELLLADKKEMLAVANPLKGFASINAGRCSEAIEEKVEQFLQTEDAALIATLRGLMERCDLSSAVSSYSENNPVEFIFGEFDEYIPLEMRERVIELIPSATIQTLPKSGHMGYKEEPGSVYTIVSAFLGLDVSHES